MRWPPLCSARTYPGGSQCSLEPSFGAARSLAVLQYLVLGRDGWQTFLAMHSRLLERLGTLATAAFVLVAVAWSL